YFPFIRLQIPCPATPFPAHLYRTPGVGVLEFRKNGHQCQNVATFWSEAPMSLKLATRLSRTARGHSSLATVAAVLVLSCFAAHLAGKDKKKVVLPPAVLKARTVAVIIEPDAGMSVSDPLANKTAREDVEKALMKWGRCTPVMEGQGPDRIGTVRRGPGK